MLERSIIVRGDKICLHSQEIIERLAEVDGISIEDIDVRTIGNNEDANYLSKLDPGSVTADSLDALSIVFERYKGRDIDNYLDKDQDNEIRDLDYLIQAIDYFIFFLTVRHK